MPKSVVIASALQNLQDNQIALAAAIEEIALQFRAQGLTDLADNVQGCLRGMDDNLEVVTQGIADLCSSWRDGHPSPAP